MPERNLQVFLWPEAREGAVMGEKKALKEAAAEEKGEKKMGDLSEQLLELDTLERHLKDCIEHELIPNTEILLLLVRAITEKICYYEKEYDLEVPSEPVFYVEDYTDFIRMKEGVSTEA